MFVHVSVCEIGEGQERESKKGVNICMYVVRGSVSGPECFLRVCVLLHARLCTCDGDEVKRFTLHFSLCVYPFGVPHCKKEASFHSFVAFQCILYTLGDPVKCRENRPSAMSE